jgi:biotin transport system substrate-specific component
VSTTTLNRWEFIRYNAFHWRYSLRAEQKLALALGMAIITGLLAQVRIPLPWTPVPVTGQTLAVLLSGVLLGGWWGGLSMVFYAALGIAGVPWFTGWQGGLTHLLGPTGGYIIGFILAAMVIGHLTDRYVNARRLPVLLLIMLAGNLILVYIPGLLQLGLWMNLVRGQSSGLSQLLAMGFLPFVIGDLIKVLLVSGLAWGITPKQAFDGRE